VVPRGKCLPRGGQKFQGPSTPLRRDERWGENLPVRSGEGLAYPVIVNVEIVIGRGLAYCAHPAAAWRRLRPAGRALLVGAYAAGSYVTVLTTLMLAL
jgi:hypothetical protein